MEIISSWATVNNSLFLAKLAINLCSVFILVRGLYYKNYQKSDHFLSFFSFNIIIFLLGYSMNQIDMSLGSAFGLFAVFSILRYRTEGLSSRDVTYLFLSIAIGLITAVTSGSWLDVAILNIIILSVVGLIEWPWLLKKEFSKRVIFDNPKLLLPQTKNELLQELKSKVGLDIHRVETIEIDLIRDSAILTVFYYE